MSAVKLFIWLRLNTRQVEINTDPSTNLVTSHIDSQPNRDGADLSFNSFNVRRFPMERTNCLKLSVNPILSLEDLGLDRSASMDEASRGLARISEAQIARSILFPAVCP